MANPPDQQPEVRPVILYPDYPQAQLAYDPKSGLVSMDSVALSHLNTNDFKRIHAFWRKLERIKGVGRS
jgi:hypothetical protein